MFDKIILILMLSMILLSAALIALPMPLVWGALCLTFIGLLVMQRSQQPR